MALQPFRKEGKGDRRGKGTEKKQDRDRWDRQSSRLTYGGNPRYLAESRGRE